MTERDHDLEEALGGLPVPDHAPEFWSRLDARLAEEAASGGRADRAPIDRVTPGHAHAHADTDGAPAPEGDDLVLDDESGVVLPLRPPPATGAGSRRRRIGVSRPRRWIAAAAAAAVALVGGAAALSSLDEPADVVTVAGGGEDVPSEPGDPPDGDDGVPDVPAPAAAVDPSRVGSVERLGPGLVVGVLPAEGDSPTVLVRGRLPSDELGCEGAPLEGLLVLGADGTTTPVLTADGSFVPDGADVHPAPVGDGVAVISRCEGFLSQLLVGRVGADGVPTDLVVVAGQGDGEVAAVPGAPTIDNVRSLSWSADGARMWIVVAGMGDDDGAALWSYTPATGAWSRDGDAPGDLVAAVQRADGSMVALTASSLIIDGGVQPGRGSMGLALSPDGHTVAAFGPEGVVVLGADGQQRLVDLGLVTDARFLPDGSTLVVALLGDGEQRETLVVSVGLPSSEGVAPATAELGATGWGWFRVLPHGGGLAVTVDGDEGLGGFADPAVEIWRFASS